MQFMFSRKSGIVLAALLGVQLILPASGWALTGRDVALKADQVDTSRTSDMSMAMIIKRGDQQLVRFMAMKKKKFPDSEKQHIRFLEPGDIRNTAYLTWSYRDINKDDDMWVYMPAESLVRRISGGSKKGSFMRSDYANEDISRREVDKDTYTLLPDEALSGVDCHVLEAKAVFPEKTNYSKRIIWIRKDIWLPAKIDFYDQGGNRCKELVFGGYKEIQGIWTASACAPWDRIRKRSWKYGKWPTTRRSPKISFCRRISRGRHENPVPGLRRLPLLVRFRPCRRGGRSLFGRKGLFRSACD